MSAPELLPLCPICKIHSILPEGEFCGECTEYVKQDQVYQRELMMAVNDIEIIHGANLIGRSRKFLWADPMKPPELPTLNTLIRKSRLSDQQRQIVKLHFSEGLSFFKIAKILGIAKGSVQTQIQRSLKKGQFCLTKLLWMKGKDKLKS